VGRTGFTRALAALLAAAGLAVAGCGDDEAATSGAPSPTPTPPPTASATATPPTASAPSAPSPPPDAPTPTATPTTGEDQPGGGGDEEAARVPVAITVGPDGTVSPSTISVPAFLALELQVRNRTGGSITVGWEASEPAGTFEVGVGKTGTRRVAGVKAGRYRLAIEGAGAATVVAGAEPGP
jgi:hypothetical protein